MVFNFDTSYLKLNPDLYSIVELEKVENPKILILNKELMKELDIEENPELNNILSGNKLLGASISQAYAGHQFGHFAILGDGRAALLGEHVTKNKRYDVQLKGSGRTPYSRGGDGKATVNSMIREYIYCNSLNNLNVDSSQALAVILTNEKVYREEIEDGAMMVRVMKSHIRIGTFEYVSYMSTKEGLMKFTDYVINRHYDKLSNKKNKYILFFEEFMNKQIKMVVNWLRIGFVHGVMNTDNMSITGETFDYGPCSFMNHYDLYTKFSRVDRDGRYSFGKQEGILLWNLQRFAETLIPIIDNDEQIAILKLEEVLDSFNKKFKTAFYDMMKSKLGIKKNIECNELIDKFLEWIKISRTDYTNTFIELINPDTFYNEEFKSKEFLKLKSEISKIGLNKDLMEENNPYFIPRNYIVEKAINEYVQKGNLDKVNKLLEVIKKPYKNNSKLKKYMMPPKKEFDLNYYTHCNT